MWTHAGGDTPRGTRVYERQPALPLSCRAVLSCAPPNRPTHVVHDTPRTPESLHTCSALHVGAHTATPQAEASASPPVGQHPTCAVRDGIVARRVSSWLVGCVRAHISSLSSSPHTQYMAGFGMPLCGRKASADRGNQAASGGIRGIGGRIGRRRGGPSCSTPPSTPLHPPHPPPRPHAATPSHRPLTSCAE